METSRKTYTQKDIGAKFISKTKLNINGLDQTQIKSCGEGLCSDVWCTFSKTFVPVARHEIINLFLAIEEQKGWKIYKLDIKSAFLNGFMQEETMLSRLKDLLQMDRTKTLLDKKGLN